MIYAGVTPFISCLKQIVNICEQFAHECHFSFNPSKSKLINFNIADHFSFLATSFLLLILEILR